MVIKTIRRFTFHYVSIKSNVIPVPLAMLMLFTFHYVSIKSGASAGDGLPALMNLHSTMYLLNPL